MKLSRPRSLSLAIGLAVALALWLWQRDAQPSTSDIKTMSQVTQNMRTYCVGRFLIDAPTDAQPKGSYGMQIANVEVKSLSTRTVMYQVESLRAELQKREATLRATPAPKGEDGPVFLGSYQTSPNSFLIHYQPPEYGAHPTAEAFVVRPGGTFFFSTHAYDGDDLKKIFTFIQTVEPTLSIRRPDEIPTTPGFCIDNGLIAYNPPRGENVNGWTWKLPGHPDVTVGIATRTNRESVDPGILDREASILREGKQFLNSARTLRKRRFDLNGMQAQEWSIEVPSESDYNFKLEIPGKPSDSAAPFINLSMRVKQSPDDGQKASITVGEAMALWDAVIQTLRPRPGAF